MLKDHRYGVMKKGAALVVAACFLLGSSTSALAAGKGVTVAYENVAESTSVRTDEGAYSVNNVSDAEDIALLELMREYNLNPEDVVITDDEVNVGPSRTSRGISWTIPVGKTYMSSGFKVDEGDMMSAMVVGTPIDIEYETGVKDPDCIMHYVSGSGTVAFYYMVETKGRHYFYVSNLSETEELNVEATVIVTPKEELEGEPEE